MYMQKVYLGSKSSKIGISFDPKYIIYTDVDPLEMPCTVNCATQIFMVVSLTCFECTPEKPTKIMGHHTLRKGDSHLP